MSEKSSTNNLTLKTKLSESLLNNLHQIKRPEVTKPFLIIKFLSIIQQFCGMSILRVYVVKIFNKIFEKSDNELFTEGKVDAI